MKHLNITEQIEHFEKNTENKNRNSKNTLLLLICKENILVKTIFI